MNKSKFKASNAGNSTQLRTLSDIEIETASGGRVMLPAGLILAWYLAPTKIPKK